MDKLQAIFTRLRAHGLIDVPTADRLDNLLAGAAPAATIELAIAEAFDALDDSEDSPSKLTAMALLASATFHARSGPPPRPPLADAQAKVPANRRIANSERSVVQMLTAAGAAMEDSRGVSDEFTSAVNRAKHGKGPQTFLRANWADAYPEDRRLGADPAATTAAMEGIASLVASGGICNPVDVDYSIPMFSTDARPVRDSLPSFSASRGGIRFLTVPTLASTSGATGLWTAATDAAPGGSTKPILTITCPGEDEVFVDAVTTRLKIGNMLSRFSPEVVSSITQTAFSQAARVAETNLLSKISSYSTAVSSAQLLGASRDLLATLDQATAAYRYRTRLPRATRLAVLLPEFARDMLRADLARQLATDGNPLAVSDAEIDGWFSARGLSAAFSLDGLPVNATGVPFGFQGFGAQTPNTVLANWPTTVVFWIFAQGSFVFLDGGRLDVSVVRDSTLNSTNDFEIFHETFENIAFRGLESLQVVASVRPNGLSAATKDTGSY